MVPLLLPAMLTIHRWFATCCCSQGDILFLNMGSKPISVGEIIIFKIDVSKENMRPGATQSHPSYLFKDR